VVVAIDCEKFVVRRLPERPSLAMFRLAASGQDDPPLASILHPRLKRDIAIPNERPQIVADRRTVGNERASQFGQRWRGKRPSSARIVYWVDLSPHGSSASS
jgi:hypothetical protein